MSIRDKTELYEKLVTALAIYPRMIVQEEISGEECRMLVVGGKVLLAVQRIPPEVRGDGCSAVEELIDTENKINPLRAKGYEAPLSTIEKDDELIGYISKAGYSLKSVLASGVVLRLRGNSNLGTGGTARDVTDIMHEDTKNMCIEVADKFGLGICGVDVLSADFSIPLRENGGVILEMNDTPGLGGDRELTSVNTGREILRYLFEL